MSERPVGQYTLHHLIQDMQELRRASGQPSLRQIARESARVVVAYGTQGFKDAPQLFATTLADTLNGKRKLPPRWPWLIVYVQTCREIAKRSPGLHDGMSDEEAQALWRKRLEAVYVAEDPPRQSRRPPDGGAAPSSGAPAATEPGGHTRDRMITRPGDAQRRPGSPGDFPPPPPTATGTQRISSMAPPWSANDAAPPAPGMLTLTQERLAHAYGPHGLELLTAAENRREPDASYRIGLLLLLDGHRHEALAWLMQAEYDGRHPLATGIIELDTFAAAVEQAFELGEFSATGHDLVTAAVYYGRAAMHGHLSAAYRLADIYHLLGHHAAAKRWRSWAAERERGDASPGAEPLSPPSGFTEITGEIAPTPIDDPHSTPPEGLPVLG